MTSNLVETDIRAILATADGNYVAAYDQIVGEVDKEQRSNQIVNRKARVEAFKAGIAENPRKTIAAMNKLFTDLPKKVRKNAALSENDEPRQLTVVEASNLMDEILAIKKAKDDLTAREEEIKRLAFGHMTEQFAADGEDFPEHVNGSIDVPEHSHRFAREGAGRKDPSLDEKVLRSLVGDVVWAQISDREVEITETVNIGKLMARAAHEPALLESVRRALKVGEWKSSRLNVRPL